MYERIRDWFVPCASPELDTRITMALNGRLAGVKVEPGDLVMGEIYDSKIARIRIKKKPQHLNTHI